MRNATNANVLIPNDELEISYFSVRKFNLFVKTHFQNAKGPKPKQSNRVVTNETWQRSNFDSFAKENKREKGREIDICKKKALDLFMVMWLHSLFLPILI